MKWESTDAPMTSAPISRNLAAALLKEMISVGHTKVKSLTRSQLGTITHHLQWVEEQYNPFSFVVGELYGLELITNEGSDFKSRGRGADGRYSGHDA